MSSYIVEYKSIAISWFMFLSVLASGLGHIFSKQELEGMLAKDKIDNLNLNLVVGGLLGSRLYYALAHWEFYGANYWSFFHISHLTLDFSGVLIFGSLILYLTARREEISFSKLLAVYIQATTLGLIIGVWSYYFDNLLTYLESVTFSVLLMIIMLVEIISKEKFKNYKVVSLVFLLGYLLIKSYLGI